VTWRFRDRAPHNVQLANGPRGLGTHTFTRGGSDSRRFVVPGTYQLFCYLHPITMHQTVTVRGTPPKKQPVKAPQQNPPASSPPAANPPERSQGSSPE
jgi:hypothetical protein